VITAKHYDIIVSGAGAGGGTRRITWHLPASAC